MNQKRINRRKRFLAHRNRHARKRNPLLELAKALHKYHARQEEKSGESN